MSLIDDQFCWVYFFATLKAFSATETHSKRSSIVAIKVCKLFSQFIVVHTSEAFVIVSIDNPVGTSILSGETAWATAWASRLVL